MLRANLTSIAHAFVADVSVFDSQPLTLGFAWLDPK